MAHDYREGRSQRHAFHFSGVAVSHTHAVVMGDKSLRLAERSSVGCQERVRAWLHGPAFVDLFMGRPQDCEGEQGS